MTQSGHLHIGGGSSTLRYLELLSGCANSVSFRHSTDIPNFPINLRYWGKADIA
jgi:hypothetical protein